MRGRHYLVVKVSRVTPTIRLRPDPNHAHIILLTAQLSVLISLQTCILPKSMDEKLAFKGPSGTGDHSPAYAHMPPHPSHTRRAITLFLSMLLPLYILASYFGIFNSERTVSTTSSAFARHPHSPDSQTTILSHSNQSTLVPLEAHIMSKCPDACDCLHDLVVPAMERISENVDFRLSFIGRSVYLPLLFLSRSI